MPELIAPTYLFPPAPPGIAPSTQEREILAARRAFASAQRLLAGSPILPAQTIKTGWYASSVSPETGFFALIDVNSGLDALLGEIVKVTFARRSVFVYVLSMATLTMPFEMSRRAYGAIARLSLESIKAKVEVVD